MKYIKIFISIFIVSFFYNIPVHSSDRVAFVDIDYLIKNSTLGKEILNNIEKFNVKNIEKLKEREKILKDLDNEIKKNKMSLVKMNLIKK